jgi:hypothetical protein
VSVIAFYNDESQYTHRPIIIILSHSGLILYAILLCCITCCIILTFCFLWHEKLSYFCVFQIVHPHARAPAINMHLQLGLRRSHWPRGLRRGSAAALLLGLRVRIPPGSWMFVSCEGCVLSTRGLYVGLITGPVESYQVWQCPMRVIAKRRKGMPWAETGYKRGVRRALITRQKLFLVRLLLLIAGVEAYYCTWSHPIAHAHAHTHTHTHIQ